MTNSLFASLLNNITLLLALGFLYSFCAARWGDWRTLRGRMVGGFLFGAVAMARILKKRLGKPEDIGAAVAFLSSDEADYITGTVLYVDGGWLAG